MQYKYEEIKSYFEDFIEEHDQKWIKKNFDDLHHEAFNTDYYIIGTQDAIDWLGSEVFNVIQIIKEHKTSSNKDLILAMDYIMEDFEFTKKLVLKGTEQLDRLELTYNTILKEYQKRMKPNDNR